MGTKTCLKCGKSMDEEKQFYKRRDGSRMDLCKKCLTMHVDNFNPETYTWILKDMDYPYVPAEWNTIRNKEFAKNPNLNGTSVLGKYLSKMKLKQWDGIGWVDSERIQAEAEEKERINLAQREEYEKSLKIQLDNGEITEAQYKTLVSTETQNEDMAYVIPDAAGIDNPFSNPSDFMDESELIDVAADLTDNDKVYLAMKWGRYYKPSEWVALENDYNEMIKCFGPQDADTMNTLILICKTNLKMNQAIDQGDVEGYQKLSKVSESLRKSAKFTAAQNKKEEKAVVDCVGTLVAYCEKNGGKIPKYEYDTPKDIIDKIIDDLKVYTRDLIYEDTALAKQIEDYLKKREIIEQQKKDREEAKEKGLDYVELEDEDYQEYYENIEEQKEQDREIQSKEVGEE